MKQCQSNSNIHQITKALVTLEASWSPPAMQSGWAMEQSRLDRQGESYRYGRLGAVGCERAADRRWDLR